MYVGGFMILFPLLCEALATQKSVLEKAAICTQRIFMDSKQHINLFIKRVE